jgi:hypothetical protein
LAEGCEYERLKGSPKEFEVVPCLKPVSVLTSVRSFATLVGLVEHTVPECTHLAVGNQVEGIEGGDHPCTASAAFEGTCM